MFKKLFKKVRQLFDNDMYVICDAEASSVILSKGLYNAMRADHPCDERFDVLFAKMRTQKGRLQYAMFFNPIWEKHGVSNPKKIQTIPVTLGKLGHVGFQSIQPSVAELFAMYGLDATTTRINISRHLINEEPYYLLEKD